MSGIILHHYPSSPFGEKVRICLGIKGLAWHAVEQPVIMPKPDLGPLTGGYRRIPVMQIGADVYCDSTLIVEEIERRFPEPTLHPSANRGLDLALQYWTDRELFQAAVAVIFGGLGDHVDPAFVKDREALSGRPFDTAAMRAAVPLMRTQLRGHAGLLERQLSDGRAYLAGDRPGLADAAAYYNFWFIKAAYPPEAAFIEDFPQLKGWIGRVAGIGHGSQASMTPAEALAAAKAAEPARDRIAASAHPLAGQPVTVAAMDYGREPVAGTLLAADGGRISLLREDPAVGEIAVHFPVLGYALAAK